MLSLLAVQTGGFAPGFRGGSAVPLAAQSARPSFAAPVMKARAEADVKMLSKSGMQTVPLTGQTLAAALKLRCDTTGAQYAIYWSRVKDDLIATGYYATVGSGEDGFVAASAKFILDATGQGPVAKVKNTGETLFIDDVSKSSLKRKELARKYGVSQVVMMPFEDGVLEFGNTIKKDQWDHIPEAPVIPKPQLRQAFEDLGALYAVYWKSDADGNLNVIADYENPNDVKIRLALRNDGNSFVKVSRGITLRTDGEGPAAQALRDNKEVVIGFGDEAEEIWPACQNMKRADAAKEFGICDIHFVPVHDYESGEHGVLEYGVSTIAEINPVTLDATLKMQADSSGAGYAIYWKQQGGKAVVAVSYLADWYKAELKAAGKTFSFIDASETTEIKVSDTSPAGEALRTRQAFFVKEANKCSDTRAAVVDDYLIESIAYVPVVGGVIEYGTTKGGRTWADETEAISQTMPNEEIDYALSKGSTYMIFWQRDEEAGVYRQSATYERPANALSKDAENTDSYIMACAKVTMDIDGAGPVSTCGKSGTGLEVPNTATYPNFKRRELAMEWGVGKFNLVPLETGVLEFGTVTKDKRETTSGSEYAEAVRQYRRTVFMHDDWVKHRSTDRFFKTIVDIKESGVLRSRGKELSIVTGFATFLVAWNMIAGGYTDFDAIKQPALIPHLPQFAIPLSVFSLTGSSLGLLLVFRTNAAYARWDDARKVWGSIINNCRSLVRQGNTFFVEDRYPGYGNFRDYRRRTAAETSAFTRCLRSFLRGPSDDENLKVELKLLGFTPKEINGYMKSGNRQVYALQKLAETIRLYGMDGRDRSRMDQTLSVLCDNVGACERIFKSPIPLVYTRHTSRFVGVWLGFLPLAIWGVDSSWNHLATIPSSALIVFFLLGIEELGLQIEEPFGILPLEAFVDGSIGPALNAMVLSEDAKRKETEGLMPAASLSAGASTGVVQAAVEEARGAAQIEIEAAFAAKAQIAKFEKAAAQATKERLEAEASLRVLEKGQVWAKKLIGKD